MTREEWLTVGCDAHPGWAVLLRELDAELSARWPDYTIAQIKEKFGTLHFYANPNVPAPDPSEEREGSLEVGERPDVYEKWRAEHVAPFHDVIHAYEMRSEDTCELCGAPGALGDLHWRRSTRCPGCAPAGWVAADIDCDHPTITHNTCADCGRTRIARLEHSEEILLSVHEAGTCRGEHCTIHRLSDHPMRAFPQQWRGDRGLMERLCPHGVGHPDPDEYLLTGSNGAELAVHGCDGCCQGAP